MRCGGPHAALVVGGCASFLSSIRHASDSNRSTDGSRAAKMSFGIDPAKLNLNLNLDTMDFAKIAEATKEAMVQDKTASRLRKDESQHLDAAAAAIAAAGEPPRTTLRDSIALEEASANELEGATRTDRPERRISGFGGASRTVRGIVGAGGVHDANSPASAYAQRRREVEAAGSQGGARFTLMDMLRDCAMSGNWLKAYKLFDVAVGKAFKMVLVPNAADGAAENASASLTDASMAAATAASSTQLQGTVKERELFASLAKLNAALPPQSSDLTEFDRGSDVARRRGVRQMAGVMRWHGGHFYLLLKTLLAAERVEEAERVWAVMKGIGFVQYQMDERTLNSLVGLLRRSRQLEDATQQLVTPIVAPHRIGAQLEREKALKRQMILELEGIARSRQLHLRGANERTVAAARIAEAIHAQEDGVHGEVDTATDDGPSALASSHPLRVGDFNGLLRMAQSHEGTMRVLAMMDKLGIVKDATTYASIISSHKNPRYRVEGATDEEVASSANAQSASHTTEEGSDHSEANVMNSETKRVYEAYKDKRIASAKRWFEQCPRADRSAYLYNEMLYLLRANAHAADFDALLIQFRGNTLRSEEDWALVEKANAVIEAQRRRAVLPPSSSTGSEVSTATAKPTEADASETVAVPVVIPAAWTVRPNGVTYELLIRRCRYRHDWEGVWELFREMQTHGVRGTAKLYHMLLTNARIHPPMTERKHGDVSSFILDLYAEMRRNKIDVHSVDTTLSLVNAWSATRRRRRWS